MTDPSNSQSDALRPDGVPGSVWRTSEYPARVPDVPTLDREIGSPPVVDLLNRAVHGVHETIDRLADQAMPVAQKLGDGVVQAEDAIKEKADQLGITRDQWLESVRDIVRNKPLVSLAVAAALGLFLTQLLRQRPQDAP